MIQLRESLCIAKGGKRACYRDPNDLNRCIKVYLPRKTPGDQRRNDPWWKQFRPAACYDENIRDLREISGAYAKNSQLVQKHIPRVYGIVSTSEGPGLSMELIQDLDGSISRSAKQYTIEMGITRESIRAINELHDFLEKHRISLRDAFPHNIAYRRQEDNRLEAVVIDGLGSSSILPFEKWIRSVHRKQLKKRIARLHKGLNQTFLDSETLANSDKGMLKK